MKNLILILLAGVILTGCQSQNSKTSKISSPKQQQQKHKKIAKSAGNSVQAKIRTAARKHRVPVALALAVSHQESGHRCNIRGAAGELGPLQIKPASARGLWAIAALLSSFQKIVLRKLNLACAIYPLHIHAEKAVGKRPICTMQVSMPNHIKSKARAIMQTA